MEKNSVKGGYSGKKISQKPDFHHFWNCGHILPKHKTKNVMDNISVMINMYAELEKILRWYILEIFKMVKMAKMAIK